MTTTALALEFTAQIVASYVGANPIGRDDVPALIQAVYDKLTTVEVPVAAEPAPLTPAVPVRKSVTRDFIVCLEDGERFKSLKRHLRVHFNLTPDEYRAKWGLPADYPMVAPAYSEKRSQLAKDNGLGRKAEMRAAA